MLFEKLEFRTLLTGVTTTVDSHGTLFVTGTQADDAIYVFDQGGGVVAVGEGSFDAAHNPTGTVVPVGPGSSGSDGPGFYTGVQRVVVDAKGGADYVNASLTGVDAIVSLGSGNDTADVTASQGSCVLVDGGNGNDRINGESDADSVLVINGGNGNDFINAFAVNGSLVVLGGNGSDTILVENDGTGCVVVDGGNGNDNVTVGAGTGTVTAIGGNGNDTLVNSGVGTTQCGFETVIPPAIA